MDVYNQTFTLTFGDQGENHKGMQMIGKMAEKGFSLKDLLHAKEFFSKKGCSVEIYHLNKLFTEEELGYNPKPKPAYVLVARNAVSALLQRSADELYEEQEKLEKDTKAFMYGRVVDKKARHNLCFDEKDQDPDYENGKGRIISFKNVPLLSEIRKKLKDVIPSAKNLIVEGNYYYDLKKCYIGFHGDAERRKVVGIRLGASFNFHYQWYGVPEYDENETEKAKAKNSNARRRYVKKMIGKRLEITLNHGDLYIMSEKAVGTDWMSKKDTTLRHAAGDSKTAGLKGINKNFVSGENCLFGDWKRDKEGYVIVEFVE